MKTSMKLIPCLVLVFMLSSGLQAQVWTTPQLLIPSQDNCTNLSLCSGFLVWEHQIDSATSAIYSRPISPGSEPVCLAQIQNVIFANPKIFWGNFILFETNLNGNTDIYGIEVNSLGSPLGEMQPLVATPENDHDISCPYYVTIFPKLAWMENETLKAGNFNYSTPFFISNIASLDSAGCENPGLLVPFIAHLYWIKHLDSVDVLKYSNCFGTGNWSEPVIVDSAKQIHGLQTSGYDIFSFSAKKDSIWFMKDYVFDEYGPDPDSLTLPIEQDYPFDFDAYFSPAQSEELNGSIYQAFAKNAGDHNEIFYYDPLIPEQCYNVSEMGVDCRNPQFFGGESGAYYFNLYLTWEAFIDRFWQIYYSTTQIYIGGIEENEASLIKDINISPNPFSDQFQISFTLEKPLPITVDLMDIKGRIVTNLHSEICAEGSFSRTYDMTGFSDRCGLYFIRFGVDGKYSFKKVVKGK